VSNLYLYPAAVGADLLLANYEQESSSLKAPEGPTVQKNIKNLKLLTICADEQQRAEKRLGYLYNGIHTWAY
jgi:hypothetical protein